MAVSEFGNLKGQRAVVTGSSTGIGRAMALELARGGADVIVHCYKSVAQAQALIDELKSMGRAAQLVIADLTDLEQLDEFAESAWNGFNGVDLWVNNAGADLLTGPAAKLDYREKLELLFQVDIRATALLSRAIGRRMTDATGGTILNIGWDKAHIGMEGDSGELFATAKSAIMALTRSLALSLAPRVRVNCIAPGWIRTAWGEQAGNIWQERVLRETPLGRWGTPEDVARVVRFLASPDAAFLTGQVINVNGGTVR